MAGQAQEKATEKAVSFEELMEVVTSYKCRICDFATSSKDDMSTHLRKTHITSSAAPSEPQPSESQGMKSEPAPVAGHTVLPECAVSAEPGAETVGPSDSSETESISSSAGHADPTTSKMYEAPAFFSNLGLTSSQSSGSHRSLVSPALLDPKVLTSQMRSAAKNLPTAASCQSDIQLLSLNSNGMGRQSLTITSLQLTGSGLSLVPSTAMDSVSVPFVENPKDLGTGPTSIAPITKELFLCGVCSMGFTSADECNSHMEQVHHVQVESVCVSDTIVDRYEQRVSVGTQATGKRPGRKRKSEMPPPSSPPSRKAKEWSDQGRDDDENDEDWIPGRSLSTENRDGRQRRKIRAPKALKEDYVTEKKRTYRKRQMIVKECFQLECSYMGCPTKFRSQDSLDIHHKCHNKEDDAFTCIHCQEPFPFWKPLRIHLYRSHKVDCDMFQCDVCEYKTDTLHKLGVHREIHSETRPYTCDVCGKGFKQLSQMKNHQIIHAEHQHQRAGRERWFLNKVCEVCKRTFANSKCLKKHVEAVHGQSKPFKCQFCSHTTAWKAMLILHERTHTGEKPFKCDVCPYATGDHNSLRRHKMRHTGQRQYKCQLCSYTCIQTISLKTHMRNKHPTAEGVVYTCQLCKFRTINKLIYDNHLEDHRNGLIPTEKVESVSPAQAPITVTVDSTGNSGVGMVSEETVQFMVQVKKMDSGELHASKEDMDRLNCIPQLTHSGVDANQLIYTALHIGSHIEGLSYTAQLPNGVQCTVLPTLMPTKGVLSSYSITFHAPHSLSSQPPVVVDFRSLTEEVETSVERVGSVSSELGCQGAGEGEEEAVGVGALSEVPQGSGDKPPLQGQPEAASKVSEAALPASGFKVLQVSDKGSLSRDGKAEVKVSSENLGTPAATLVVSQAGVDSVLRNIIVMDGDRVVQTLTDNARAVIVGVEREGEGQEVVEEAGERKEESSGERRTEIKREAEQSPREGEEGVLEEGGIREKVLVMAADNAQENANTAGVS